MFVYLYETSNPINDLFCPADSGLDGELFGAKHFSQGNSYIISALFSSHICYSGRADHFHGEINNEEERRKTIKVRSHLLLLSKLLQGKSTPLGVLGESRHIPPADLATDSNR